MKEGKPVASAELLIQYADFSVWQRGWLQGKVLEEQLSYWKTVLAGDLPNLELPTDYPRPAIQRYDGASNSFTISIPASKVICPPLAVSRTFIES